MSPRHVRTGLAGVVLLALVGYALALYLGGGFRSDYRVDAVFARAGQNLRAGGDVKVRGVLVGVVAATRVAADGTARVELSMSPGHAVPRNVTAAIRAKTLFGEKFVDLRVPDDPSSRRLRDGDVIPLERTVPPFEVETVLTRAVPLLDAVDPQRLGAAVHALAQALVGNEQALRRATVQGERTLSGTQETLPELERNLRHLARLGAALDDSDENLLRALAGLERTGAAGVRERDNLRALLESLPGLTRDLADVVTARERDLADLSAEGAAVLRVVAAHAAEIPALVDALDSFLGVWIGAMSTDDGEASGTWGILLPTPPGAGTPYAPGTEPRPETSGAARAGALRRIAGGAPAGTESLAGILYEALPTEELLRLVPRLESLR